MGSYIYEKKKLHINRYRRKSDRVPKNAQDKETCRDRRRGKIRKGIILEDYDRRQKEDSKYNGVERRSGTDRRSGKDRRENK